MWTPDPTFYPSPRMAMKAPAERLAESVRRVHAGLRAVDPELAAAAWEEADPLTDRERQVLRLARDFFGPEGELGLEISKDGLSEIGFTGAGGSVEVTARPRVGDLARTDVTILSREFDVWAERFLGVAQGSDGGVEALTQLIEHGIRGWLLETPGRAAAQSFRDAGGSAQGRGDSVEMIR